MQVFVWNIDVFLVAVFLQRLYFLYIFVLFILFLRI